MENNKLTPINVILGSITFLDPEIDGKHEAIIHRIDKVIECSSEDEASEVGENSLDLYESYLIPSLYRGTIKNDTELIITKNKRP